MGLSSKQVVVSNSCLGLKCPRCDSTNTKFCYFNNYNKSQPRYFCKTCKRHWTKGGALRSVPIGGRHKNKRLRKPPRPCVSSIVPTSVKLDVSSSSLGDNHNSNSALTPSKPSSAYNYVSSDDLDSAISSIFPPSSTGFTTWNCSDMSSLEFADLSFSWDDFSDIKP